MNSKITNVICKGSAFSFLHILNMSSSEAHAIYKASVIRRMLDVVEAETRWMEVGDIYRYGYAAVIAPILTSLIVIMILLRILLRRWELFANSSHLIWKSRTAFLD